MHPFITFVGREIPVYGLMALLGALFAFASARVVLLMKGKTAPEVRRESEFPLAQLFAIAAALVGAVALGPIKNLFYLLIHPSIMSGYTFWEYLRTIFGEIIFFGGVIGGFAGMLIYRRIFAAKLRPMLDISAVGVSLGHAVGRVGCYFAGCCYGIEVHAENPLALVYPAPPLHYPASAPPGVPLLNIPLMESGFLLLLHGILVAVYLRTRRRGLTAGLYLLLYALWRFVIEFYRGDTLRGEYFGLSTSQYISLAAAAVGLWLIFGRESRRTRLPHSKHHAA
ncbi:MAG: prolipoprotein diacylglyceryl transferase [Oscillospiraceae bacterium]|jgi:phosphatidylglycerol:prolipoprotein diacylglycerol transferase|nr:prolipoprotein diacylglyceryl transferase [Oscillospiraceae bacterium]